MEKIYILKHNKLFLGPYSLQKLKERRLKPDDMVWFEGLADWTRAERIDDLRDAIVADPLEANKQKHIIGRFFSRLFCG